MANKPGALVKGKGKERDALASPSKTSKADQKEAAKSSTVKTKKPEKVKLRRIHVSGLPDITEQEAKDRFKSFGEVVGVDGLGKLDATGKPLRYAFLNIKTTKSKLAQCMNLLSGSMWKGSTLRIAEAKPTFMEKLEQERKQAAKKLEAESSTTTPKEKKRRRNDGEVPTSEDLINESNVKEHPGWKLDPKTHTPIFPIVMRPDHPLPPPPTIEPVAGPSSPKKDDKAKKTAKKADKASKKNKKAEVEQDERSLSPPTRARMVKIDPSLYPIKHLREEDLQNLPDTSKVKAKPVKTKKAEEPPIKKAKVALPAPVLEVEPESEDNMSRSSDGEQTSVPEEIKVQGGTPKATHKESSAKVNSAVEAIYDEQAAAAERKANLDLVAKLLGGIPKDLKPVEEAVQMQLDESDEEEDEEADGSNNEEETITSEDDSAQNAEANNINDDKEVTESPEVSTVINPASYDAVDSEGSVPAGKASSDTSTADENSEDPVEEPEDRAEEDAVASRDESEEVEEDDGSGIKEEDEAQASVSQTAQVADVQMQSLTEMFKPQEAAACFSIGDLLDDVEMDDLEVEVPVASAQRSAYTSNITPWSAPVYAAAPTRAPATTRTLFFPFPLEGDELPGGLLYGMDGQEREKVMDRSWTGTSNVTRFKRTQTVDEIATHYESVRRNISEQVRKRHREAVKKQKRHGGKRMAQTLTDDA